MLVGDISIDAIETINEYEIEDRIVTSQAPA
jgi:hypothetical protein